MCFKIFHCAYGFFLSLVWSLAFSCMALSKKMVQGRSELTDIICPMYPDVTRTVKLGLRDDEDRPVILCEYSHSMNNSNGNLHLYWENFWKEGRLQGGFIWDMIDQGLRKRTRTGVEYFAYGGDFGDKVNDKQFCINVSRLVLSRKMLKSA